MCLWGRDVYILFFENLKMWKLGYGIFCFPSTTISSSLSSLSSHSSFSSPLPKDSSSDSRDSLSLSVPLFSLSEGEDERIMTISLSSSTSLFSFPSSEHPFGLLKNIISLQKTDRVIFFPSLFSSYSFLFSLSRTIWLNFHYSIAWNIVF